MSDPETLAADARQQLLQCLADGSARSTHELCNALGVTASVLDETVLELRKLGVDVQSDDRSRLRYGGGIEWLDPARIANG
ncbi:MAG: hypothetical protein ACR2RL_16410, partial [Gammaproteobacteria bacterium]